MKMQNFALGLITSYLGFLGWKAFGEFYNLASELGKGTAPLWGCGMYIGILLIPGGPLFWWLFYPLWRRATRRKK